MIRRIKTLLPVVAFVFVAPVFAQQQASQATSHTDLLRDVENFRAAENKAFQDRKAEFDSKAQAENDQLLRTAEQQRTQLNAASDKLSDTYQANELRISNLNQQLRDKAAALGLAELFGLAHQAANDNSSILQQSLITTQFPPPAGQPARDE